jgi:hypothetical protein
MNFVSSSFHLTYRHTSICGCKYLTGVHHKFEAADHAFGSDTEVCQKSGASINLPIASVKETAVGYSFATPLSAEWAQLSQKVKDEKTISESDERSRHTRYPLFEAVRPSDETSPQVKSTHRELLNPVDRVSFFTVFVDLVARPGFCALSAVHSCTTNLHLAMKVESHRPGT